MHRSELTVLNLDDTYKLCVLTFMHGYLNNNLPSSFHSKIAEPNRTKSYKLERVLNIENRIYREELKKQGVKEGGYTNTNKLIKFQFF